MTDVRIGAAVVTVSDTRTFETDTSGAVLAERLTAFGAEVVERIIVSDDFDGLRQTLYALTGRAEINLVITTGGTGFSERDNTPEATRAVILKEAPGIAEAIRRETAAFNPKSMLSRGICGIRDSTLIINFPGAERAVVECFEVVRPILRHAVNLLGGRTGH